MIKISKKVSLISLILILLISLGLRFYQLGNLPSAFHTDEMALGYNGWSLLRTGKDEWGERLPLVLRSFDDYKPAVYSYLSIPGIALFGLSQFSTRLPAAIFGCLLSILVYFLVKQLTKDKLTALISALVIAISPWHIEISRTAIEAGVALSLSMLVYVLIDKKIKFKGKNVLLAALSLAILYTYHTARILFPLLLLVKLVVYREKSKKLFLLASFLFLIGIGLSLTSSSSRFAQISLFSDRETQLLQAEAIREDGGPISTPLLLTRIFHNKYYYLAQTFTKSYLTNTSLSYLFLGGAQPPRVTIPETGQFLLCFLPFFLIGIAISLKKWCKFDQWLLIWLLLAPIPASLTTAEIPHTYRTLYLLPVVAIYIGLGINFIIEKLNKPRSKSLNYLLIIGALAILTFFTARGWHQYRVHQQVHRPWHRQFGYKNLITKLNNLNQAEKITITNRENEPFMAILFYNQIDPEAYQALDQKRLSHKAIEQGAKQWSMWHYVFSEDTCPHDLEDTNPNHYYVVMPTCELPKNYERVDEVSFLDGVTEFYLDRPLVEDDAENSD
ncbi:MAG: glycosyltransferase family 39 protein [Patescibacteria group bacterium]|nr:glycosyltransferase family 39 protein [Patescibacteria group bacterium]